MNLLEPDVHDGVLPPIFVVEVPPFLGIDFESLSLHGRSQGGPMLALCFRSALIISVGALRHLVIEARHGYLMSGLQVVERQIDSATTVVTGTILGIGDKGTGHGVWPLPRATGACAMIPECRAGEQVPIVQLLSKFDDYSSLLD